jgi:hypothetical protein
MSAAPDTPSARPTTISAEVACVPTTWLDPLLTGPDAVIGKPPYGCPDIERLLSAIRSRVEAVQSDTVRVPRQILANFLESAATIRSEAPLRDVRSRRRHAKYIEEKVRAMLAEEK